MKARKKLAALLLSATMVLSSFNALTVMADSETVCTHHTHDETCGYVEAVEGHECEHQHDDSCGYEKAVEEVKCECADTDSDGKIVHTEGCGYVEAKAEVPCNHVHDDSCKYPEAVEGTPCNFDPANCEICNPKDNNEEKQCTCGTETDVHEEGCPLYVKEEATKPEGADKIALIANTKKTGGSTADGEWDIPAEDAKVSIDVTKVWDDENDKDGKRPDSITVELLANGGSMTPQKTITLPVSGVNIDEPDRWFGSFTDLDVYDENGKVITYTVSERAVTDYTTTYNEQPQVSGIQIGETWEQVHNEGKLDEITEKTIFVFRHGSGNGNKEDSYYLWSARQLTKREIIQVLNSLNSYNFGNNGLKGDNFTKENTKFFHGTGTWPVYGESGSGNDKKTVTVSEKDGGYTVDFSQGNFSLGAINSTESTTAKGATITNTYNGEGGGGESETITIPVQKVWKDADGKVTNAPNNVTSITVKLMKGETKVGTLILSASNEWSGSFTITDYDPSATYTVVEEPVDGYETSIEPSEFNLTGNNGTKVIFIKQEDGTGKANIGKAQVFVLKISGKFFVWTPTNPTQQWKDEIEKEFDDLKDKTTYFNGLNNKFDYKPGDSDPKYYFEVTQENGDYIVIFGEGCGETEDTWCNGSANVNVVVTNTLKTPTPEQKGKIPVTKWVRSADNTQRVNVTDNFYFGIYRYDEVTHKYEETPLQTIIISLVDTDTGNGEFTGLPAGKYIVKELKDLDNKPVDNNDADFEYTVNSLGMAVEVTEKNANGAGAENENHPNFINYVKPTPQEPTTNYTFTKLGKTITTSKTTTTHNYYEDGELVDTEVETVVDSVVESEKTALVGAEFELRRVDDVDPGFGIATATSDANGRVTFTGLTEGEYTITEVSAPAGYEKWNGTITVKVTNNDGELEATDDLNGADVVNVRNLIDEKRVDKTHNKTTPPTPPRRDPDDHNDEPERPSYRRPAKVVKPTEIKPVKPVENPIEKFNPNTGGKSALPSMIMAAVSLAGLVVLSRKK